MALTGHCSILFQNSVQLGCTIRFGDHLGKYEILSVPATVKKEGASELYRILEEDAAMTRERHAEES